MWDILFYLMIAALLGGAGLLGYLFWTGQIGMGISTSGLFAPKPERRLDVVEQSNVDGRRRLVLIRRDNTEHLIMTGGPVDVVIETGITDTRQTRDAASITQPSNDAKLQRIQPNKAANADSNEDATPVFSRTPRTLGQAAGEN